MCDLENVIWPIVTFDPWPLTYDVGDVAGTNYKDYAHPHQVWWQWHLRVCPRARYRFDLQIIVRPSDLVTFDLRRSNVKLCQEGVN